MITVSEARKKILEKCPQAKIDQLPLNEAGGFVLAEDVYATMDIPHFNQSAMDGYAFSFNDWDGSSTLQLAGEAQTGSFFTGVINSNQAIRIFTGAAIPEGTDTIVIQENIIRNDDRVTIVKNDLRKGSNVRLKGSQTRKGELVLKTGQLLTPASISFLAGLGIDQVKVYANPSVSIITTGKELVRPGEPLEQGKIYESNSFGLNAVLKQIGISPIAIESVDDNEEKIMNAILRHLNNDILLLTGGVSVGEYDFVASALEKCGVKKIFHKVKQKPGKPFYFGVYKDTLVFALPGNPASVLTCFYEYVADVIGGITKKEYFKKRQMALDHDYSKKAGLTLFLKGKIKEDTVAVLNDQESYKMNSFAIADCIITLDEEAESYKKSDKVVVRIIV